MGTRRTSNLLISVALIATAQAQSPSARYAAISDQIYFHVRSGESGAQAWTRGQSFAYPPPEDTERLTAELHDLAQSTVQTALAAPGSTAQSVETALSTLQGPLALSKSYSGDSNAPFAETAMAHGSPLLVAGFAILRGGQGIPQILPYMDFYSHASGEWKLVAERGSEFAGRAFSIAQIPSPTPDNEAWFLVWGQMVGDNGARLKAKVYSFDGFEVREVWTRDALPNGHISVVSGHVQLEYEDYGAITPDRPKGLPPVAPKHMVEHLQPGPAGLEPD